MSNQLSNNLAEFNQLINFANYLCKSEALPATYKNSANVLVALQTGKEMGLQPMQSLRMLYIVNGNIKPWGTAYPYFLKKAGYSIKIGKHESTICEVTVSKGEESYTYTATTADVKKDSKAMGFAPKEKLYFHACSRIINYYLPEIMSGMNFGNQVDDFTTTDMIDHVSTEVDTQPQKSDLQKFIEGAETLEALESVKEVLSTESEQEAYNLQIDKLSKQEPVEDEKKEPEVAIVETALNRPNPINFKE